VSAQVSGPVVTRGDLAGVASGGIGAVDADGAVGAGALTAPSGRPRVRRYRQERPCAQLHRRRRPSPWSTTTVQDC